MKSSAMKPLKMFQLMVFCVAAVSFSAAKFLSADDPHHKASPNDLLTPTDDPYDPCAGLDDVEIEGDPSEYLHGLDPENSFMGRLHRLKDEEEPLYDNSWRSSAQRPLVSGKFRQAPRRSKLFIGKISLSGRRNCVMDNAAPN